MQCQKCGKELKEGVKFCNSCGTKVEAGLNKTEPVVNKSCKKSRLRAIFIGLIVGLLVMGGLVAAYMGGVFDGFLRKEPLVNSIPTNYEEETVESLSEERATVLQPSEIAETLIPTQPATEAMTAAMPTAAPITAAAETAPVRQGSNQTQDENIQYIRTVYNRTVQNQDSYQKEDARYYNRSGVLVKASIENGNAAVDAAMTANGYGTYRLAYYYDDANPEEVYPIFIYAVIDQKEYRYYFKQGVFIRRIGPEGSVNDNPEMNSFMTALCEEGRSFH